ncbi:hypothetical protein AXF42_Ash010922 [Apostasia shenzhenica]|uniref:Uncharacterized protein n=1 Tax=Apostasia shenzhenica TaxID=1088818 RepID=A0A2H9ZQL4_9ASPA|nr:hypothetical protein AXF42_Ash010922 [Apostasia shenzhenica]
MGVISIYRGNLHRVPDTPRQWPPPPPAISLSQFRHLVRRRTLAISRLSTGSADLNPSSTPSEAEGRQDDKDGSQETDGLTVTSRPEFKDDDVVEDLTACEARDPPAVDPPAVEGSASKEVSGSFVGGGGNDGLKKELNRLEAADGKEERKNELEKKLHILNEKKHYLVQMLKQILNAEEEIKRRGMQSSQRSFVPTKAETAVEIGSAAKNPSKINIEVTFGGDLGVESDAAANHSIPATSMSRTPRGALQHSTGHLSRGSLLQAASTPLMVSSLASPLRFALTSPGQGGHAVSLPSVSTSGSLFVASSPSPAASGGTTSLAFRGS